MKQQKQSPVSITMLLITALCLAVAAWRADDLQQLDLQALESGTERTEAEYLFEQLRNEKLLGLDGKGEIRVEPRDYALAREVAGIESDNAKLHSRLLKNYYARGPGKTLQSWIEQWNRGRVMSAIRDNRPEQEGPQWTPHDAVGIPLGRHGRVPLEFGYVMNGELAPGFGSWAVAPSEQVEWRTKIRLKQTARLTIHVIGKPDISLLPRRTRRLACKPKVTAGQPNCAAGYPSAEAQAFQVKLTLPAGNHQLRMPVTPIRNPQPDDRDLPIALKGDRIEWLRNRERYTRKIAGSRPPSKFVVRTADGIPLTDENGDGEPTAFALKNGLAGLVGFGTDYKDSLSGMMARANTDADGEITLTLDSKLQQIAQTELERRLKEVSGRGDAFKNERRGAVVVLDARNGKVLAAANHPSPPDHTSRWDRAAYSVTWPNRDPFRFTPWIGVDAHVTPGSTFKVLTSLAAIKAASDGRDDIGAMLKGWSTANFQRNAGLAAGASCYQAPGTSQVCNYRGGSMARSFHKALRSGACGRSLRSNTLGVREAVRDSLNIWFVRLAEKMDRGNLNGGGINTGLSKWAKSLGFSKRHGLFPEIAGIGGVSLFGGGRGSVMSAMSGDLDLFHTKMGATMQRLAQNSFGQGVRATPLQMARVASVAATGTLVQPTLLQTWEGREITPAPAEDLGLNPELLGLLQQGMKAVPEAGTAAGAFGVENPADRCRTYGKTGTAQSLVKPKLFSGWFIGWRDKKKENTPDIAFSCVLTHSINGTGGSLCGRLVARILKQWER